MNFLRRGAVLALVSVILAWPGVAASQAASKVRGARERKVEEQKEQNKEWLREAKREEREYYTKAEYYYKRKLYREAAKWYKRVLNLRYKQWPIRVRGSGSNRYEQPALRTATRSLDTNYTRNARVRMSTMDKLIASKRAADEKAALDAIKEKAELAMMLDKQAIAYKLYGDAIRLAKSLTLSKMTVQYRLDMEKRRKAILANAGKPLDAVEKLIKAKKITEAVAQLEEYGRKYAALMALVPSLKNRYEKLLGMQAVRTENREQEGQARVTAGDVALLREDYLGAKGYYETAMGMYPGTEAAKTAARKLAKLMEDPKIRAAIEQQRIEIECGPLLARARHLVRMLEPEEAAKICSHVLEKYPKTKWAEEAQRILDEIAQAEAAGDGGE